MASMFRLRNSVSGIAPCPAASIVSTMFDISITSWLYNDKPVDQLALVAWDLFTDVAGKPIRVGTPVSTPAGNGVVSACQFPRYSLLPPRVLVDYPSAPAKIFPVSAVSSL